MLFVGCADQGTMFSQMSDNALVAKALAGDKEAYRCLVEKYQRKILALAYEITQSQEDAEDVAQEAFVKAYLSLASFKGESSFYTWLYRIVYNMAIDLKRKMARRGGATMEFDESQPQPLSEQSGVVSDRFTAAPEMIIQKEEMRQLQKILEDMSEEHRRVILLREVEGRSYDEISQMLDINKGTVMSRLFYARKRLQKGLQDNGASGELDKLERLTTVTGAALKAGIK